LKSEKDENVKLEAIHYVSSKLLKSISNLYITNRKRLLSLVAEYLSEMFENYNFISGEDFTFVDARYTILYFKRDKSLRESYFSVVGKKRETILQTGGNYWPDLGLPFFREKGRMG